MIIIDLLQVEELSGAGVEEELMSAYTSPARPASSVLQGKQVRSLILFEEGRQWERNEYWKLVH